MRERGKTLCTTISKNNKLQLQLPQIRDLQIYRSRYVPRPIDKTQTQTQLSLPCRPTFDIDTSTRTYSLLTTRIRTRIRRVPTWESDGLHICLEYGPQQ